MIKKIIESDESSSNFDSPNTDVEIINLYGWEKYWDEHSGYWYLTVENTEWEIAEPYNAIEDENMYYAPGDVDPSQPWVVQTLIEGRVTNDWFDTQEEAINWIQQYLKEHPAK